MFTDKQFLLDHNAEVYYSDFFPSYFRPNNKIHYSVFILPPDNKLFFDEQYAVLIEEYDKGMLISSLTVDDIFSALSVLTDNFSSLVGVSYKSFIEDFVNKGFTGEVYLLQSPEKYNESPDLNKVDTYLSLLGDKYLPKDSDSIAVFFDPNAAIKFDKAHNKKKGYETNLKSDVVARTYVNGVKECLQHNNVTENYDIRKNDVISSQQAYDDGIYDEILESVFDVPYNTIEIITNILGATKDNYDAILKYYTGFSDLESALEKEKEIYN